MTCAQGLLRLLWGGARSWSATGLPMNTVTITASELNRARIQTLTGPRIFKKSEIGPPTKKIAHP